MAQAAGVRVCAVVDTSPRGRRRAAMRAVILQYVGADTATAAGWRRWYTISHQVAGGRRKTVHRVAMLMARGYTRRQAAELLGLSHQMVAQVWPKRSVPLHLQRCARRASRQDVDKDPQAEAWWTEASRWTGVPFQHKTKVISLLRSHGMTLDEVRSEGVVAMLCNRMVVRCLLARGVDGVQPVMGGGVVGGWQGEVDNCGGLGRVYGGEVLRYDGEVARRRCRSPVAS